MTPEVDAIVNDMIETMYAAPGVGLAAPPAGAGRGGGRANGDASRPPHRFFRAAGVRRPDAGGAARLQTGRARGRPAPWPAAGARTENEGAPGQGGRGGSRCRGPAAR